MWYKILGVKKKSEKKEIESAYVSKLRNPEINSNFNTLVSLQEAYKEGIEYSQFKRKQNKKAVIIIVCFLIYNLLLGLFIIGFVNVDKILKPDVKEGNQIVTECLQYSITNTMYEKSLIEPVVKEKGYEVIDSDNRSFKATKNINGFDVIFEYEIVDSNSQCTIYIEEVREFEDAVVTRKAQLSQFSLYLIYVDYFFTEENDFLIDGEYTNDYLGVSSTVSATTNLEDYNVYPYDDYIIEKYSYTYDIESNLEFRDIIFIAVDDFR